MKPFEEWLDQVALSAMSSKETLRATYDIACMAIERQIPGDFVECGVYAGAQCAMMARAICAHGSTKRIHLFDGFTGVPAAGEHDVEWTQAGHPPGTARCSLADCQANMAKWFPHGTRNLFDWHCGDFRDTVPRFSGPIAILRLDGDLYESTRVPLEHLYPLLSPGGWLIVDDFGISGARKALTEYLNPRGPEAFYMPGYFQKQP